jgi:hypothetical protein
MSIFVLLLSSRYALGKVAARLLAAESDSHPRLIRIALDYAAEHAGEVRERIDRNRDMAERSRRMAQQRESLLACHPS